jgi:hypothetical protein
MDKLKSRFRLDRSVRNSATQASPITSASPADNCFTFRAYDDPSPSTPPAGSFESDIASSEYQQRWETWTDFENWIVQEQRSKGIELHLVNTYLGLPEFERKLRYVCSRAGTGGLKTYVKRHPEWNRKIENKRTDCKCRLLVKQYPGISTVLGSYRDEHDHALGNANLRYTNIPKETREHIAGLLRLKLEPDHIVGHSRIKLFLILTGFKAAIDTSGRLRTRRSIQPRSR